MSVDVRIGVTGRSTAEGERSVPRYHCYCFLVSPPTSTLLNQDCAASRPQGRADALDPTAWMTEGWAAGHKARSVLAVVTASREQTGGLKAARSPSRAKGVGQRGVDGGFCVPLLCQALCLEFLCGAAPVPQTLNPSPTETSWWVPPTSTHGKHIEAVRCGEMRAKQFCLGPGLVLRAGTALGSAQTTLTGPHLQVHIRAPPPWLQVPAFAPEPHEFTASPERRL